MSDRCEFKEYKQIISELGSSCYICSSDCVLFLLHCKKELLGQVSFMIETDGARDRYDVGYYEGRIRGIDKAMEGIDGTYAPYHKDFDKKKYMNLMLKLMSKYEDYSS